MSHIVTIIVHGTFATQETWWRLGTGETFADRLEHGLAQQGMAKHGLAPDPACGVVVRPVFLVR